jgi:hypothetical protein
MTALLALLLAAALPEATPLSLSVEVTPEEVTLGEPIEARIAVEHDARDVYSLGAFDPAPLSMAPEAPEARTRREDAGGGKARTFFELRLADYTTLEPRIPDLTLSVIGPDGARQLSIRGRPLKFRSLVAEEGEQTPEHAHHGPKPPVPVLVHSFLWAWLLAAVALAVGGWVLRRRALRRKRDRAQPVPEVFADEMALERLAALRTDAPWTRGEGRAAIFEVSGILRAYLGSRLQFNAPDLTSEEFLTELRRRRLIGLDLSGLIEQVRWEDLVKFAKLQPSGEECLTAIDVAESIVHHTRPLRVVPARAA